MEFRHIHYWQYQPGPQEEAILDEALTLSRKNRHNDYLVEIAKFIATHTKAMYVLFGQLSDDLSHVHSLVFLKDGQLLDNYTYALRGTPCEGVLTHKFCYHPFDVAPAFPDDKELRDFHIESYLGSILSSPENEPIGLVVLMDEKQIENAAFCEHLIMVLSPAIEEELQALKM